MSENDKDKTPPVEPAAAGLDGRIRDGLKGLMFQTNREVKKDGEPTRYVPAERPMTRADVLAAKLDGKTLVLVTSDGRKHRLEPKAAA